MIVGLILLWHLKAGIKPGLALHLLGATVFTLCFGWALAFIGLCAVLAGVTLNGAAGFEAFAVNALLMAGVGVARVIGFIDWSIGCCQDTCSSIFFARVSLPRRWQ
jgi:uncharacterized membrane protein